MSDIRNILFIMTDQLRWDYLNCAGMGNIRTPAIDALARRGVRFTQAHVQATVCGPSRMCFLTGRYAVSHGATYNNYPLPIDEWTIGDYLVPHGLRTALIGKTHMAPDLAAMKRLGVDPTSDIGIFIRECGLEPVVRDDGLHPDPGFTEGGPYQAYLKAKGYEGHNLWHEIANSAHNENGDLLSGWYMRHAGQPAVVAEEHSETAWVTDRAIDFITDSGEDPWCLHLSYIKPHWPYIVPAPYHDMFGANHVPVPTRDASEQIDAHPVYAAYMGGKVAQAFQKEEVRQKVIPAYMGLIKQCDDQLGRLLDYLEETGRMKGTMIVLTSDHGDYLGDHWLGEKDLFHEPSVKIPLIIYDPRSEADGARGSVCDALVESIDLAATFVEAAGGDVPDHIIEGRSLMPWLRGEKPEWRSYAISEYDFSVTPQCAALGLSSRDARLFMVFDGRYKMIHAEGGFRPMLFDLEADPEEFQDLGKGTSHQAEIDRLYGCLSEWGLRMSQRVTRSEADIKAMRGASARRGILPFLADGSEVPLELTEKYRGPVRQKHAGS